LFQARLVARGPSRKKRAQLVLIAGDATPNTRELFVGLCCRHAVPYRIWGRKEDLGRAIGKTPRAAVAILDRQFASRLQSLIDDFNNPGERLEEDLWR